MRPWAPTLALLAAAVAHPFVALPPPAATPDPATLEGWADLVDDPDPDVQQRGIHAFWKELRARLAATGDDATSGPVHEVGEHAVGAVSRALARGGLDPMTRDEAVFVLARGGSPLARPALEAEVLRGGDERLLARYHEETHALDPAVAARVCHRGPCGRAARLAETFRLSAERHRALVATLEARPDLRADDAAIGLGEADVERALGPLAEGELPFHPAAGVFVAGRAALGPLTNLVRSADALPEHTRAAVRAHAAVGLGALGLEDARPTLLALGGCCFLQSTTLRRDGLEGAACAAPFFSRGCRVGHRGARGRTSWRELFGSSHLASTASEASTRVAAAKALFSLRSEPDAHAAVLATYDALPLHRLDARWEAPPTLCKPTRLPLARRALAEGVADWLDPRLVPALLERVARAGEAPPSTDEERRVVARWSSRPAQDAATEIRAALLATAARLARPEQLPAVRTAAKAHGTQEDVARVQAAAETTGKCTNDAACFLAVATDPAARPFARLVAISQLGVLGRGGELLARFEELDDASRRAAVRVVEQLAPEGDAALADRLDAIAGDLGDRAWTEASCGTSLGAVLTDAALRLRVRASPR